MCILPDLNCQSPAQWKQQRARWIALAEDHLYGHAPDTVSCAGTVTDAQPLWDGQAVRETLRIAYGPSLQFAFTAVLTRPADDQKHAVITWNQFDDEGDCPVAKHAVLTRGYAIASFIKTQLAGDGDQAIGQGDAYRAYPACDWGALRVWAWGHQLLAEYLSTRREIDSGKMACTGLSRGGKAALAAGIFEERFQVCVPVCSGCGGCGCFRYLGDLNGLNQNPALEESIERIAAVFPHWWAHTFPQESQAGADRFPLDSHVLRALLAPRALLNCEGKQDTWSNPYGAFISWRAAQPVFDMLGGKNAISYHEGGHAFTPEDWQALLDFCDETFYGKATGRDWNTVPFA